MDLKAKSKALTDSPPKYEVKSLALSLTIVEFIASAGEAGVSVSEVARAAGTPKSNAYRILQTLCDRGYASDSGEGPLRRYRLGPAVLRLANAATTQRPLGDLARPILKSLAQETNLTSRFAVLVRGSVVALVREAAPAGLQISPFLGQHELAHCSGVGKALMSVLPEQEKMDVIRRTGLPRRTANTITDPEALLQALEEARRLGYAIDDEEDFEGVFGVGSPVFDHAGRVVGGINVTGLKLDRTHDDLVALAQIVNKHAARFSMELGYDPGIGG